MHKTSMQKRDLAAAQRGLIVQRVLVEGWSPAEAGEPFGLDKLQVERLIAVYRRHGMASLHGQAAVKRAPHRRIAIWFSRLGAWLRGLGGAPARRPASRGWRQPGVRNDPARRSLWN